MVLIDPTRTATFRAQSYTHFMRKWKTVAQRLRERIEREQREATDSLIDDYEIYLRSVVTQEFRDTDNWLFILVLTAYTKGIKSAERDLKKVGPVEDSGFETEEEAARSYVLSDPEHRKEFLLLLRRIKAEIESLKEYAIQQALSSLTENKDGQTVAAAILVSLRSPVKSKIFDIVVRSFANATLITFLKNGIQSVQNLSEAVVKTAGDARVCSFCQGQEGKVYTIQQAMNLIPFHTFCRCKWIPVRDTK